MDLDIRYVGSSLRTVFNESQHNTVLTFVTCTTSAVYKSDQFGFMLHYSGLIPRLRFLWGRNM